MISFQAADSHIVADYDLAKYPEQVIFTKNVVVTLKLRDVSGRYEVTKE